MHLVQGNKTYGSVRDLEGYDADGINTRGFNKEGYYYERQTDGTLSNTGLKYNKFGFKANGAHMICKNGIDLRGFDVEGRCIKNLERKYDRNGFYQDGTYRKTGKLYYKGYNAFGVDENGKDSHGKEPIEITFTKEYVNGILKAKAKEVLERYNIKSMREVNLMLYKGTEMFPKLKQAICKQIIKYQKMIQEREEKIKQLETKKIKNIAEIEKLQKENTILKKRISNINPMQEL